MVVPEKLINSPEQNSKNKGTQTNGAQFSNRLRVLFCCEAVTLAHVVRPWLLARGLLAQMENPPEIYFASSGSFNFIFEQESPELVGKVHRLSLSSRTPREFGEVLSTGGVLFDEQRISNYVEEELRIFENIKPNLVIGDLRPSLAVSARIAKVPYWNITNAYWSNFAQPIKPAMPALALLSKLGIPHQLKKGLFQIMYLAFRIMLPKILESQGRGINIVRKKHGLSPYPDYLTGFSDGDEVLWADSPEIVPTQEKPDNHHFIGPLTWSPNVRLPIWWAELPKDLPIVYVSLGSSGDLSVLTKVLDSLATMQVTVVLTTAGRDIPSTSKHNKLFIADFIPGPEICERASIVISNGGSPTSYQALQFGKPVLGIPSNMDQMLAMARVEAAGAGLLIRSDVVNESDLNLAVKRLLEDRKIRDRAKAIELELRNYEPEQQFAKLIQQKFVSNYLESYQSVA